MRHITRHMNAVTFFPRKKNMLVDENPQNTNYRHVTFVFLSE